MKTTTIVAMVFLGMLTSFTITAQNNVGIGTTNPDASAVLELESTTQGFLPPRMTEAQRDLMPVLPATTIAAGLVIYCTDGAPNGFLQVYNGTAWTDMCGGTLGPQPTVQQRLNVGQTPISIYNSLIAGGATSSDALDSLYGKTCQGGLIAYLNTVNGTGLIAAPVEQATYIRWTTASYYNTEIGTMAQSTIDGYRNTAAIVAQAGVPASVGGNYAAYLCDTLTLGGYTDWYLPSKDELYQLYKNLIRYGCSAAAPGGTDTSACSSSLGGFVNGNFWSSTEYASYGAWGQLFSNGLQTYYFFDKNTNGRVRAVRAF